MKNNTIIVVIDPGHGGENLGAEYENFTEKEMTMKVARAMYDKLSEFEGIEVYLTREADADLTLKERVEIADQKNADFFFCLHFNMSVNHDLYGAETWISSSPTEYAAAYDFSKIEMEMLTDLGLFDRGIKTKLKKNKNADYYGVIREATERHIPSVIIEHCHLDNINDYPYYHEDTEAWLKQFGELDAIAVAKYYGLYNPITGEDYSNYNVEHIELPKELVKPDSTDPETAILTLVSVDQETGYANFSLEGADSDCRLLYYSYSFDQGESCSERFAWDVKENIMFFQVPLQEEEKSVSGIVYNLFDRLTVSNEIRIPALELKQEEEENTMIEPSEAEMDQTVYNNYQEIDIPKPKEGQKKEADIFLFFALAICIFLVLSLSVFTALFLTKSKKRSKRR